MPWCITLDNSKGISRLRFWAKKRRVNGINDLPVFMHQGRYSPEVKERAVRMVFDQQAQHESQWSAISSIASKIDCTRETLRTWVRRAERDAGKRAGLTTDERQRLKELERENRELKRANEILRKASAFFAQAELDRRPR